eukprot:Rhum_TRINITY_DN14706_c11_g2::Rhum_TRINITY_DN14706_c11_g2_i1::g.112047::m.112047
MAGMDAGYKPINSSSAAPISAPTSQAMVWEESLFEDSPSYQIFKPRHDPTDGNLKSHNDFLDEYSVANGHEPGKAQKLWDSAEERNPPLLETQYRLGHGQELNLDNELKLREPKFFVEATSSAKANYWWDCLSLLFTPCCGPCIYKACVSQFEVPTGNVQPMEDGEGGYLLAGSGVHRVVSPFKTLSGPQFCYAKGALVHGDWAIVIIDQGFIGLAMDKGQPVLLPPGFHIWKSTTLKFVKKIDLNEPVIFLGPYTLLTVDEGYTAVTQNNGKQEMKRGGEVHLLMHRNHKFEKFLTTKIQTDNLQRIEVITGDNVLMLTDATVNWRIADVDLAARNAAETMRKQGEGLSGDISKLRNDVLQQASASLSSFIGTVNYSDTFAPAAAGRAADAAPVVGQVANAPPGRETGGVLFDQERMFTAVGHANAVACQYGVEILSINIISAKPADSQLMTSLARGAVAAAEAQQLETAAQGEAKAMRIAADAQAAARIVAAKANADRGGIEAQAAADAEEERARGAKQAADLIATSKVAIELAKIDKTGQALPSNSSLFFGANPSEMGPLLANPNFVKN